MCNPFSYINRALAKMISTFLTGIPGLVVHYFILSGIIFYILMVGEPLLDKIIKLPPERIEQLKKLPPSKLFTAPEVLIFTIGFVIMVYILPVIAAIHAWPIYKKTRKKKNKNKNLSNTNTEKETKRLENQIMMNNNIHSEYVIESCSKCGGTLSLWDVEIRDGYKCFKCKHSMRIMLIYKPEEEKYDRIIQSEFAYERHPSMIPLAATFGVILEKRYSKEVRNSSFVFG